MKLLLFISLFAISTDTVYNVKFTASQLQKHFNKLNAIEELVKKSNLTYPQVMFCINSIDSLKLDIYSQLPDSIKKKLISVVLLSPSTSTDFETHVWDKLGGKKKRSMDVVAEVNKLGTMRTVIILGNDDADFPINSIKLKNYGHELLPGGHHYEGNTDEVAKTIMKYF